MPFFVPLAGMAGVPGDYYLQFHADSDARGYAFVSGSTGMRT
jgi:hypothetical protein